MIVVAIAAIFGAALGLFMRNVLLALVIALGVVGVLQFGAMFVVRTIGDDPNRAGLAACLHTIAGDGLVAVLPNLAAAGFGALIAAVMLAMSRKQQGGDFWLPEARPGRRDKIRYAQAIVERPSHVKAESRIDRLLKQ